MTVGRRYAPEWRDYLDPLTRRRVRQLTDSPAEDYHLYFYNPSVTPDGKYLIFLSERAGRSNLFRLDLQSGYIVQLTDARQVRAEYWPFTEAVAGVGAPTPITTCMPMAKPWSPMERRALAASPKCICAKENRYGGTLPA